MKKLSALLICACLLTSCGQSAVPDHANVSEGHFSYEVDGCTFDYTSYIGCSRNDIEGVLKNGDEIICEYSASGFVGNYPEKVVNLFDNVYYVENREVENYNTLYYIAKGGKIYPEFSDFSKTDEQTKAEQLEYISEYLRDNITKQEIKDIFSNLGYDDKYILKIYNNEDISDDIGSISEVRESYEITEGNTDGCVFEYTKYISCERNDFEGVLKVYDDVICKYSADCSEWNYPEIVVHLFDDIYYVCNSDYGMKETIFYIVKDGKMYPDFTETDEQKKSEQLEYISEFLFENMTEQQITDIFNYCSCDESDVLFIYNYSNEPTYDDDSDYPDYSQVLEGHSSYEIDGCTFEYTSYLGCVRNDFEGVLKKGDEVICEYKAGSFVGNYPEKVVNILNGVYYVENRELENYDTLYYIAKDGKMYPDFLERDEQKKSEQLEYISEFLHENITEQEIRDIFSNAGYDDTYILKIYNEEKT